MSEEIKQKCDNLTEKLDNTAEIDDWLDIQEYLEELLDDNEYLKDEIKELKQELEENYVYCGENPMDERDFF